MKAATNTSGNAVPVFHKPDVKPLIHQPTERIKFVRRFGRTIESRLQLLLFGVPNHLVFVFWLLSGVARRHPYSQRTHAEADRQAEGH